MCQDDDIFYFCSIIASFDLNGELVDKVVMDTVSFPHFVSTMSQSCDDCLTIFDDKIYFTHQVNDYDNNQLRFSEHNFDLDQLRMFTFSEANSNLSLFNEGLVMIDSSFFIYDDLLYSQIDSARIMKINQDGERVWESKMTLNNSRMNINSVQPTKEGNIACILTSQGPSGAGGPPSKQKIQVLSTDGQPLEEFTFPEDYDDRQQNRLLIASDGSNYFLSQDHPLTGFDGITYGRLNKLNWSDKTIEWSLRLPNHAILDWRNYRCEDIIEANNGDLIVCGRTFENSDSEVFPLSDDNAVFNGFMIRISPDGEIVWLRIYKNENTVAPKNEYGRFFESNILKVRELEDGRLVAGGHMNTTSKQSTVANPFEVETGFAWLMVLDENGCLEDYPCQEVIRLDSLTQVDPPIFELGTKWTYEYFPESPSPNEIIHSYVEFEIVDTMRLSGLLAYQITNNRGLDDILMRQGENEIWFWNEAQQIWQLTYDFNALLSYPIEWQANSFQDIQIDTIIDLPNIWLEERGFQPVQYISLTQNSDTLLKKEIQKTIGSLSGGLTFSDFPEIREIRCFEAGSYAHNFGPLFPAVPCDTVYTEIINSVSEFEKTPALSYYPNPVDQILNLTGDLSFFEFWEIYTVEGVKMYSGEVARQIDVSKLNSGMYVLRLFDGEGRSVVVKVVKG